MSRLEPLPAARIVLLSGGDSAEREVSLQSGSCVASALRGLSLPIHPVDPALTDLNRFPWQPGDVAFIALHGGCGENGEVQQLLEHAGIPYTGSGPAASQLAFSKSAAKVRFQQSGVPTPPFVLIHRSDSRERLLEQAARIGYPVAIKPDQQGSSLGVNIVHAPDALLSATADCFRYGPFGLIEKAVAGSEWTLGVIDNECLPVIKIETSNAFFDFTAKYEDDATQYLFEFTESPKVVNAIIKAGHDACRAVGTAGIARADLRVDAEGKPWVLEVNTVPGLTDHSLVPKAAARAGIPFAQLCRRMLESAVQHAPASPARQVRRAPRPWPTRQAG